MRIAIFDPDEAHAARVSRLLDAAGHHCHVYRDEKTLWFRLRRETFDFVMLAWDPEHGSYDEMRERIRGTVSDRASVVLMIEGDALHAVDRDAHPPFGEYLIRPVRANDLLTLVGAQLRSAVRPGPASVEHYGDFAFDLISRRVCMRGTPITLTQKEFELARLLFRHINEPLSRARIQHAIWNHASYVPSRTLDTHVSSLRCKLRLTPDNGYRLLPIYRYGYQLEALFDRALEDA